MAFYTKVCAKTLCRYCKIVPVNDRKKISLLYVSHIRSGFFDRLTLKKIEVLHSENEEEKNFALKKIDLFASQCTYSDSSRQAELKYIYPDQRKSFLRRVKVVIKTCPLPQTSQI